MQLVYPYADREPNHGAAAGGARRETADDGGKAAGDL